MQAPCKDCPKQGCGAYHDKCPNYQLFRKERDALAEERKKKRMVEIDLNSVKFDRANKQFKSRTRLKQR